jgi:NADPH:quinone reductase-like Zn-dependent oxidoreductase
MKAITFEEFGDSSVLKETDVAQPVAQDGELLVKVAHTSVNPVDWKIRAGGLAQMLPYEFPVIPGWDVAGVVESVGSGVTGFKAGDAVYAYNRKPVVSGGCYAEHTTVEASAAAAQPSTLSSAEAAAVPLVALTAWQALNDIAKVGPSDTVLVTAGAGGVGSFAIQFAKHAGARVVTTASERNHGYVKELGADVAVDYNRADAVAQLRQAGGDGYSVVFDCAGGEALEQAWDVIAEEGRLVSIVGTPDAERAEAAKVSAAFHFVAPNGEQLAAIGKLIDAATIKLPAHSVRSVREAAAAMDENEQRHVRGKVVLAIDF